MRHPSTLKQELAALGAQTEVGFAADREATARIRALAAELEAMNPTPEPARAVSLLRGRWRLLYSNLELARQTTLARLSLGILPPTTVEVVDLYNEIDPSTGLYDNVIHFLDAEGRPGTLVMAGHYGVDDDRRIDIRTQEAIVTGAAAPVRLPADTARVDTLVTDITYLDDGFRLVRGPYGSLYLLERLDAAPMRWARDL